MSKIKRHNNAREAATGFIRSLFTEPGLELSSAEIVRRADRAGIAASSSAVIASAQDLVKTGFLMQPSRGFYQRPEVPGVPLPLVEPPVLSHEATEVARLAMLSQQIRSLEERMDGKFAALTGVVLSPTLGLDAEDLSQCGQLAKSRAVELAKGGAVESSNALHALAARLNTARIAVIRLQDTGARITPLAVHGS